MPFKKNATGGWGSPLYKKLFHFFQMNRDEFLPRYHKRSNVESTFSMIKAKFGDSVRSKTDVAMRNEALAKILCHNICCLIQSIHEYNVDPAFWAEPMKLAQREESRVANPTWISCKPRQKIDSADATSLLDRNNGCPESELN